MIIIMQRAMGRVRHACRSPCWPQPFLAMTHQCTLLVMQSHSQNACSTCMLVQQGSCSFLGVNMTPVMTGEHSTQHLYYQLSPVLLIFIWHRQLVVYR